jgi:general secretion pathway protein G
LETKEQHVQRNAFSTLSRSHGFSLIELLIVMIIIGLLASLVGPRLFQHVGQSKQNTARAQIELLGTALDAYRLDVGRYPTTEQGLEALRNKPADVERWNGPYLPRDVPLDPWGKAYIYKSPGDHGDYDLSSLGADGRTGGEGEDKDIHSWEN